MPSEIVHLHLGQCGNQIASELWKIYCKEHGITKTGAFDSKNNSSSGEIDRREICFSEAENGRYIPRAVLMDYEPRVIQGILNSEYKQLYSACRKFTSKTGCGAHNSWASGYSKSAHLEDQLYEEIRNEVEGADNLEAFTICHATAGGTGSGMGSYLLETIPDQYPKKLINTISVFPNQDTGSNVVIEPYNSILTIRRLIQFADVVTIFDNHALSRVAYRQLCLEKPTIDDLNHMIAKVACMMTSTIRFPTYINSNMIGLVSDLCPTMKLHFLMASYKPLKISTNESSSIIKNDKLLNVMLSLIKPKNYMALTKLDKKNQNCFISAMNILQSNLDKSQINPALQHIRSQNLMKFTKWCPGGLQIILSRNSPYITNKKLTGAMIANHTSFGQIFNGELSKFEKLLKRCAFLAEFKRYDIFKDGLFEFEESKIEVQNIIEEYEAATQPNFMDWVPKNSEFKY